MEPKILTKYLQNEFNCSAHSLYYKLKKFGIERKIEGRISYLTHDEMRVLFKDKFSKIEGPKSFCWHNHKGGVGKTTLNREFAIRLSSLGYRVLIVDADLQANTTASFGYSPNSSDTYSLTDVSEGMDASDAIINICPGLDILPSNVKFFMFEDFIGKQDPKKIKNIMGNLLSSVSHNYDIITFDTPPANLRSVAAILAYSEIAVIPIIPDDFSVQGLQQLTNRIYQMNEHLGLDVKIKIVINKYDKRIAESDALYKSLIMSSDFVDILVKSEIKTDQHIFNARKNKGSLFESTKQARIRSCEDLDFMIKDLV